MITQLLPDELLIKVLAWTPITSHGCLRLSCKKLRSIVNSDQFRDTRIQGGFQENVIVAYVEGFPVGSWENVSQIWVLLDGRWRQPPWSLATFGVDFSRLRNNSVATKFKSDAGVWDSILFAGNWSDVSSCTMCVLNGAVERLPPHRVMRDHPAVCHSGSCAYVIGGRNTMFDSLDASIEMFDPEVGAWTSLPLSPMPHATSHAVAGVIRDKIYVAGGVSNETTLQIFDIPSQCWEVGPPMPKALSMISGVAVNERFYVIGRVRLERSSSYTCCSFNVEEHKWTEIPMMFVADIDHCIEEYTAIEHNGRLFAICHNKFINSHVDRDAIDSPAHQLQDNGEWSKICLTTIPDLTKVTGLLFHRNARIVSLVLC